MAQLPYDQAYVEYTAKLLAEFPDDVKTEREISERGVLVSLYVNPKDIGSIIGKGGSTIMSIRQVLKNIGLRYKSWVSLKLIEPEVKN